MAEAIAAEMVISHLDDEFRFQGTPLRRTRGRPAAELVWCNFPRPTELHDYRFLGDNFREREHLKRMKARWIAKLQKMAPVKRQALLAAIADTAGNGEAIRW